MIQEQCKMRTNFPKQNVKILTNVGPQLASGEVRWSDFECD